MIDARGAIGVDDLFDRRVQARHRAVVAQAARRRHPARQAAGQHHPHEQAAQVDREILHQRSCRRPGHVGGEHGARGRARRDVVAGRRQVDHVAVAPAADHAADRLVHHVDVGEDPLAREGRLHLAPLQLVVVVAAGEQAVAGQFAHLVEQRATLVEGAAVVEHLARQLGIGEQQHRQPPEVDAYQAAERREAAEEAQRLEQQPGRVADDRQAAGGARNRCFGQRSGIHVRRLVGQVDIHHHHPASEVGAGSLACPSSGWVSLIGQPCASTCSNALAG